MSEERIGASFKIDTTQLKAGLTQANRLIRESQSEFKKAAAGIGDWTKKEDGLVAKIKSLNEVADLQKKKVEAMKEQYQKLIDKGIDPSSAQMVKLRTDINNETAAMEKSKAEAQKYQEELDHLNDEAEDVGDTIEESGEKAEKASGGFTVLKGALANLVADGFRLAIDAAKDFIKSTVEVGKTFDTSMSQVQAVSGASAKELEALRAKAKEMGETTKFTATEAADAFNYMAMAGWKTEDMISGIDGILNLAAASGSDLATTSDIVTDALTAMGYAAGDAGHLADVMAAASSNANTNVEMMGATFQYAAPLVGALGYNMEDTAVAIGLMANAGIKGEKAGTALRSIFTRLASPPKAAAEAMTKLGISLTDASGEMKPFASVMQELRDKFAGLDETQQTQMASALAGQEAMSGLLAIVNAAPEDFDKLTEAVAGSEGAAAQMSETMLDNLGGDMTILQSKIEGIKISFYENLEPALRDAVQAFQAWADSVDWEAFADKVGGAIDSVTKGFKWIKKHGSAIEAALGGIATATGIYAGYQTALKLIELGWAGIGAAIKGTAVAQWILNAAQAASPMGLIIAGIAGLVAAFVILWKKSDKFREFWIDLWDKIKEVSSEAWDSIKGFFSGAWDAIKGVWSSVPNWFNGNVITPIKTFFSSIGDFFSSTFDKAKKVSSEALDSIKGFFTGLWDSIKGIFGNLANWFADNVVAPLYDTFGPSIAYFKYVFQTIKDNIRIIWENAVIIFDWAVGKIKEFFEPIAQWFKDKFEVVRTNVEEAITPVVELFQTVWNTIKDTFSTVANWFGEKFSQAVQTINKVFTPVGEFFLGTWNTIKGFFEEVPEWFKEKFDATYLNIMQAITPVIGFFQNVWLSITNTFSNVAGWFRDKFSQAWTAIKNVFSGVGSFFGGIWNTIKSNFTDIGARVGEAVGGAFKKAINAVMNAAERVINAPIKAINGLIGKMASVPGLGGLSTLSTFSLPRMATGGVVRKATTAIIGEDGAEAVVPLEKNTQWIDKVADKVASKLADTKAQSVVVNQTNNYSQAHSRYELYKSKQQTAAAVRLAMGTV